MGLDSQIIYLNSKQTSGFPFIIIFLMIPLNLKKRKKSYETKSEKNHSEQDGYVGWFTSLHHPSSGES